MYQFIAFSSTHTHTETGSKSIEFYWECFPQFDFPIGSPGWVCRVPVGAIYAKIGKYTNYTQIPLITVLRPCVYERACVCMDLHARMVWELSTLVSTWSTNICILPINKTHLNWFFLIFRCWYFGLGDIVDRVNKFTLAVMQL